MNLTDTIVPILEAHKTVDNFEVISLGCGIGVSEINDKWKSLTGVDIYPYHKESKVDHFIQYDVRKIKEIIKDKSFDLVLCLDVIEHLTRDEGFKLIKDAEAIAKQVVVFYTPIRWDDNRKNMEEINDGNEALIHKSLWKPFDFPGWTSIVTWLNQEELPSGFVVVKWL